MLYSRDLLVELVRINMEEGFAPYANDAAENASGTNVDDYIVSKLPEAITQVFLMAPEYLLPQTTLQLNPKRNQNGSGEVLLPKDFLRITLFKMRGWDRGVTKIHPQNSLEAKMQNNPYTMAGRCKPVAVLCAGEGDSKILKYYSLPVEVRNHEVEEFLYVAVPSLDTPIEINELLLPSITYLTASLVFDIMGERERAASMRTHVIFG